MKKFYLLIVFLFYSVHISAQEIDSLSNISKVNFLTEVQRDSVLIDIQKAVDFLASSTAHDMSKLVGRYKVYRTTNMYNSLMLDTATGKITALQIGVNDNGSRFEYTICEAIKSDLKWQIIGRYELYPTGNNYNFILLDTIFGHSYQVQWSTKSKECGRWIIGIGK